MKINPCESAQWVACDSCSRWYHVACDQNHPRATPGLDQAIKNPNYHYTCVKCKDLLDTKVTYEKRKGLRSRKCGSNCGGRHEAGVHSSHKKALDPSKYLEIMSGKKKQSSKLVSEFDPCNYSYMHSENYLTIDKLIISKGFKLCISETESISDLSDM